MADIAFLDTNLLIYAANEDSLHHTAATDLISRVNSGELKVCLSPQILAEFYATVTNPKKVKYPLTSKEAVEAINGYFESDIVKLYPSEDTVKSTFEIAQRYRVKGLDIFDAQIVALMLENKINTIYTANVSDFQRFKEIAAINPLQ